MTPVLTRSYGPQPASLGAGLGLAALALVLGCTSAEPPGGRARSAGETGAEEVVRIKGLQPHLRIHRRSGKEVEQLHDGAVARAGDLVQVSYMAAGNRYGVVVSLDGTGVVTLHHPARATAPTRLEARGEHALDHSYELDAARSYERFFFVTSGDEPIDASQVVTATRRLAQQGDAARHSDLPLPGRWQQSSITLNKQP